MAASERAAWKRDVESGIVKGQHQAHRPPAETPRSGEYACQPTSNDVVLIRIQQRVGELPQSALRRPFGAPPRGRNPQRDPRRATRITCATRGPGQARLPGEDIEHPVTLSAIAATECRGARGQLTGC